MSLTELQKHWSLERLADVLEVQLGKMLSGKARAGISPKPYLRNKNVRWGSIDTSEIIEMDFSEREMRKFRLRNGDLLMCEGGEPGRTAIWRGELTECYYQKAIHRLRPLEGRALPEFFLYWFRFAFDITNTYGISGASSTIAHLPLSQLESLKVPVPPLDEQRQIARVLSAVQRGIERQERLIALTAELKKALMHRLLTVGIRGEQLKKTELGTVPESWTVNRLDTFCVLQRGFDITKEEQADGPVPVVSSGGIKSYHNVAKVQGPGVIVGRKGTLGTVHYLEGPYWPHDTTLWVKDFRGNDPRFASYFLDKLDFARFDSGASNPTLNRNTVHGETVAYPPPDEQVEIGECLAAVEAKRDAHNRTARSLRSLFRTLLHQLMTAEIRVHDLDLSALDQPTAKAAEAP